MKVSLRKFTFKDLVPYQNWRDEIDARQYMSQFYPKAFNGRDTDNPTLYVWYVIVVDGVDVGTIWLEKDHPKDNLASLGILIGRQDKFGQGIGTKAIPLAIKQSQWALAFKSVELNVRKTNVRAIACYKHCGFTIVGEAQKVNKEKEKISFFKMGFTLSQPEPDFPATVRRVPRSS
jgi:RimJ/RimL family protein N-acetyltransferase